MVNLINETKEFNIAKIKKILESGDFDQFIGARENECFEAKLACPFNFEEGNGSILRLAKYFASLGNNKGGVIICGLKTDPDQATLADIVIGLDLITEDKFYKPEELIGRGQSGIHPTLKDVEVRWFPYSKDKTNGLGAIFIPEQSAGKKYFMVIGNKELEGEEIKGEFFGIPIRNGAQTDWLKKDRIHALTLEKPNDSQSWRIEVSQRLGGIEDMLSKLTIPVSTEKDELASLIKDEFKHE